MKTGEEILQKANGMLVKWSRDFSSTMIMDDVIFCKIEEKFRKFVGDYQGSEDGEAVYIEYRFSEFVQKNNNLIAELSSLHGKYEELIDDNYRPFDIENDVKDDTIWSLAVRLSFEECCERLKIKSFDAWKKAMLQNSTHYMEEVNRECRWRYLKLLRIHDDILPIYLAGMGFSELPLIKSKHSTEKKEEKKKKDIKKPENEIYVKPDILFLLVCIYSFMNDTQKKWVDKEKNADYGRSFLENGNGIMRAMFREALVQRFKKFLYLDVIGRKLINTLFVFPRSIYQDAFWHAVTDFVDICNPLYAKSVRTDVAHLLGKIHPEKTEEKPPHKSAQDYAITEYSIIDELYWNLQYQKMEDLVAGLDMCLNNKLADFDQYDINVLLEVIRVSLDDYFLNVSTEEEMAKAEERCVRDITISFILDKFKGYSEESIRKNWNRHKETVKTLHQFYERGATCFRNESYFFDDFQQAAFFELDENISMNVFPIVRRVYIRGILFVFLNVLGWEKQFPLGKDGSEKKAPLHRILKDYRESQDKMSDVEYSTDGTYYLLWNCLNEILEWGFSGAKIVNDFRKNILLPYYKKVGIGLKSASMQFEPITMGNMRKEIIMDYDSWIESVRKHIRS